MKKFLFVFLILLFICPVFVLATDKIDINSATASQLDELTGIGPKYAQGIIDARPFSSVDDLVKVKGIGPKTLQKIKDQGGFGASINN
jgi:competence ComEA-like helix-hairpin-helix protein